MLRSEVLMVLPSGVHPRAGAMMAVGKTGLQKFLVGLDSGTVCCISCKTANGVPSVRIAREAWKKK